jgi:hypothetical protein
VLKCRNHIFFKVKNCYWQTTHKFGIKILCSVEEVLEIDRITGQISGTRLSTRKWPRSRSLGRRTHTRTSMATPDLIGFQEIGCHIVFDMKMDLTHKA